ncbi:hypothetical protein [Caballeronia sp. KNU42]
MRYLLSPQVSWRRLLLRVLLLCLVSASLPAAAKVVQIGKFCMEGVSQAPGTLEGKSQTDGQWVPLQYHYPNGSGEPGWIYVFEKPVSPSQWYEDCGTIAKRTVAEGNAIIISGKLQRLDLQARNFVPTTGQATLWEIPPRSLEAQIVSVLSGGRPVMGGAVNFAGSKAWLSNPKSDIQISSGSMIGDLDIETWARTIEGARITMDGGLSIQGNLTQVAAPVERTTPCKNTCFRLNLAIGTARVLAGELAGTATQQSGVDAVTLGPIASRHAQLTLKQISMQIRDSAIKSIQINGLAGTLGDSDLQGSNYSHAMTTASFSAAVAATRGTIAAEDGHVVTTSIALSGVAYSSPAVSFGIKGQAALVQGAVKASAASLSAENLQHLDITFMKPTLPAVRFMMPDGKVSVLTMTLDGPLGRPHVSATVESTGMSLAGASFDAPVSLKAVQPSSGALQVVIPIDIDMPAATGGFLLSEGDQSGLFKATLKSLKLKGQIVLVLPDLKQSYLDVQPSDFKAGIGAAAAVSDILAGTRPTFAQTDIDVVNTSLVHVATTSSGTLEMNVIAMVVANPKVQVGSQGTPATLGVNLNSRGNVLLDYDLNRSRISFAAGELFAEDFDFKLVDTPNPTVEFGDVLVTNPVGKVKQLSVFAAKKLQSDNTYSEIRGGAITAFSVDASRVEKVRKTNEDYFVADPDGAITFDNLIAVTATDNDIIRFDDSNIQGLKLGLKNADYETVAGVHLSNATAQLSIAEITKTKTLAPPTADAAASAPAPAASAPAASPPPPAYVEATILRQMKLHLNGVLNHLEDIDFGLKPVATLDLVANGDASKLSGSGTLSISTSEAHKKTQMIVDPRINCTSGDIDSGGRLLVPMRADLAFATLQGIIKLDQGNYDILAIVPAMTATLVSTHAATCKSEPTKIVLAAYAEGWTNGICTQGWLPPKVYACKWKWSTPEVSFEYRNVAEIDAFAVTASMPGAILEYKNNKTSVCQPGGLLPTFTGMSDVVQLRPALEPTPIPGADVIANAAIAAALTPLESVVTTAIGNEALFLGSSINDKAALCLR